MLLVIGEKMWDSVYISYNNLLDQSQSVLLCLIKGVQLFFNKRGFSVALNGPLNIFVNSRPIIILCENQPNINFTGLGILIWCVCCVGANLRRLHRSKKNHRKIIVIGQIIGFGKIDSFIFTIVIVLKRNKHIIHSFIHFTYG